MPKTKEPYLEIDNIKDDIDSLKTNIIELTKHIKVDADQETKELKKVAANQIEGLRETGREKYVRLEKKVNEKPGQSIAIAFAAGIFTSMLVGRR